MVSQILDTNAREYVLHDILQFDGKFNCVVLAHVIGED